MKQKIFYLKNQIDNDILSHNRNISLDLSYLAFVICLVRIELVFFINDFGMENGNFV